MPFDLLQRIPTILVQVGNMDLQGKELAQHKGTEHPGEVQLIRTEPVQEADDKRTGESFI